ncbi:MAG: protein kinase [Verrucomicrobiales bacterium]|nr:protein kinase [Verrucomicrobiales bacterium]
MNSDDLPTPEELAVLLPQYRFENLLAIGGMGAVYRAEQISLGRAVAIKILPRSLTADAAYRDQFKTEARLMGSLTCPHIVDVHDFGEVGDVLYIVMELLEGTNLHRRMAQEPLKQPEVVRVLAQVCDALTAAHQKGVVHRDVKPENIFIESGLRVKLGDFGIARKRRSDLDPGDLPPAATSGVRLGTPEYAAPELFDFQKHIDHRADIFSLGVVLYELLTGTRPTGTFTAPSKRRAGVDKRFDEIVTRAMQYVPGNRYSSAEEMKKDLLRILSPVVQPAAMHAPAAGKTPTARRTPTGHRSPQPAPAIAPAAWPPADEAALPLQPTFRKRRSALIFGGLAGAAAAAVVLILSLNRGEKPRPGPSPPEDSPERLDKIFADSIQEPEMPDAAASKTPAQPPPSTLGPPAPLLVVGGHTYRFIPSRLPWPQAKAAAEKENGHLACITSQEEYDALRAYMIPLLVRGDTACWLGASDAETEGQWKWITGEPFAFVRWASGAPNNGGTGKTPQNVLGWHRHGKYGARLIEWNDLSERFSANDAGGYLVEWDRVLAEAEPSAAVTASTTVAQPTPSTPSSTTTIPPPPASVQPPSAAPTASVAAPSAIPGGWQPVVWKDEDVARASGRLRLQDGWCVCSDRYTASLPAPAGFTDGAFRVRLRVESGSRDFQIKPRYAKGEALLCKLVMPGIIRVIRRDAGVEVPLVEWLLASRLKSGDEIRLEMQIQGQRLSMRINNVTVGSVETGDASPGKTLQFICDNSSFRDVEWLPLDGISDPAQALAAPSAWPTNAALTASLTDFSRALDAAYSSKLSAALKPLRDSYLNRLQALAAEKPAEAAIYQGEAALLTSGGDPPPAGDPGTPAPLAPLRNIWHNTRTAKEKPLAPAALAAWSNHLTKLRTIEAELRAAQKYADLPDVAARLREAEAAIAHFSALTPKSLDKRNPAAAGTATFPLSRPSVEGKVIAWRKYPGVTHDMGAGDIPPDLGPVVAIAAGPDYALAIRPDGTVVQWGTTFAKHAEPPAGLAEVVAIDAGLRFSAALRSDGSVVAWGKDWRGQLVPPGLKPGIAIACGEFHGHILHPDGTASYFGFPDNDHPNLWKPTPAFVSLTAIEGGREISIGLKSDGTLVFLGSNKDSQITGVPPKLKKASLIACGYSVCCALSGDLLYFWGHATEAKDAEFSRGSFKFPAVRITASAHGNLVAARSASGEWKFFGNTDTNDLHEHARRSKGAIDIRASKEHVIALMPELRK